MTTDNLLGWWAEQERELAQRRGTVEFLVEQWRGSDGPPEHSPRGTLVVRVEEAHTEAYTSITAPQCRYPQILHAYDAVARWARGRGAPTGPPREVYPVPWDDTGERPVADIALPYREDTS